MDTLIVVVFFILIPLCSIGLSVFHVFRIYKFKSLAQVGSGEIVESSTSGSPLNRATKFGWALTVKVKGFEDRFFCHQYPLSPFVFSSEYPGVGNSLKAYYVPEHLSSDYNSAPSLYSCLFDWKPISGRVMKVSYFSLETILPFFFGITLLGMFLFILLQVTCSIECTVM